LRRCPTRVLHPEVIRRNRVSQPSRLHKRCRIEENTALKDVGELSRDAEVGRLREEQRCVGVGDVAGGWGRLPVYGEGFGFGRENEGVVGDGDVGDHPMEKLDAGTVAWDVAVDEEDNGAAG
jgi:hypothetical protein